MPVNNEAALQNTYVDLRPSVAILSRFRILVAWEYWQAISFVTYEIDARISLSYGASWRTELVIGESGSNGERGGIYSAVVGDPDNYLNSMVREDITVIYRFNLLNITRSCG